MPNDGNEYVSMNHLRVTRNSEGRHCLEVLAKGGGCVVNEQLLKTHCTKELKDGDRFYIVAAHTIYAFEFQHGYRVESDECSAGPELPRLLCLNDPRRCFAFSGNGDVIVGRNPNASRIKRSMPDQNYR